MANFFFDSDLLNEASERRQHFDHLDVIELENPARSVDAEDEVHSACKKYKIVLNWPDTAVLQIISNLVMDDVRVVSELNSQWNSLCKSQLNNRQTLSLCSYKGRYLQQFRDWKKDGSIMEYFHYDIQASSLKNITELTICQCKGLTDLNVDMIGYSLPYLQKLWIFQQNLTDRGLIGLFKNVPKLQWLTLIDVDSRGKCFQYLPPLTYFAHNLNTGLHDLEDGAVYQSLRELSFQVFYDPAITMGGLQIHLLKNLKSLHVQFASGDDYFMYCVLGPTWIEHISIDDLSMPLCGFQLYERFVPMLNVKAVRLRCYDYYLTSEALEFNLAIFPNVRYLHLTFYHGLNGSFVNAIELIRKLRYLQRFTIDTRFTFGVIHLQSLLEASLFNTFKVCVSMNYMKKIIDEIVINATRNGSQLNCVTELSKRSRTEMSIICARNARVNLLNIMDADTPKCNLLSYLHPKTSYYRQLSDE